MIAAIMILFLIVPMLSYSVEGIAKGSKGWWAGGRGGSSTG
jgi:hypothetical protein